MLSKRERYIGWTAAAVVAVLLLDWLVLSPVLSSRERLAVLRQKLQKEQVTAQRLLADDSAATRRYRNLVAVSLPGDASAAESRLLNDLRTWSQQAGFKLSSIRPDRASAVNDLNELSFQATGEGSMHALARFLYMLRNAQMPLRVLELQVASRSDAADDLTVQLRISTLWRAPAAEASMPSGHLAVAAEGGRP
ncbi:MAG: GspMb/PilO family protein [Phycisphaeraceae bacterium]